MLRRQSAAIPYRVASSGELEVLLVTSRRRKRWVLPKGNLHRWMLAHTSAATEAFEEAGVLGEIERLPIASYTQVKRTAAGLAEIHIDAYPLRVNTVLRAWPERDIRQRRWMKVSDAIEAVNDTALRSALTTFISAPSSI
ncbi:NUDIX hydrolase [Sphingomonas sp. RHCKR7]|uniref:NUDIX hydrolase n=1 Tax=Sphingomonas folli TaxID=2862497 RepID=UPI001C673C0F|nr:NUDIX hydrolase [Sphingomonas folli]